MPSATANVELTDVRAATHGGGGVPGEEEDDVPLLLNSEPSQTPDDGAHAGEHVHPRPNASYTRDEHSWASKLVFSWINPVLDKVRYSTFPFLILVVSDKGVFFLFHFAGTGKHRPTKFTR